MLIGFAGVGLLSWSVLRQGTRADVLGVVAALLAPFFWSLGSLWLQRRRPDLSVRAVSGYQQLLGGVSLLVASLIMQEPRPAPTGEAWLAFGYLVVTLAGGFACFQAGSAVARAV